MAALGLSSAATYPVLPVPGLASEVSITLCPEDKRAPFPQTVEQGIIMEDLSVPQRDRKRTGSATPT